MRQCRIAFWLASIPLFACLLFTTPAQTQTQGQTQTQDVAEAARQAKLKKQQKQSGSAEPAAKPKTYTNDDIPEAKTASAPSSPQEAKSTGVSPGASADSAKTVPAGKNSATVTVSPVRSSTPHPGGSEVDWSVHNTSDHALQITMTLIVTGPCKYRYETSRSTTLQSGEQVGDNMFGFAVYEDSCPGSYNVELRATANGQVLGSATATVRVT